MRPNHRGNTIIYAIILVNLAILVAYMIFSKSQILLGNLETQRISSKIMKNIEDKASLSIKYDITVNTDGSGFTNTRTCPTPVTMSGTVGGTLENAVNTSAYFHGTTLYCSGTTTSGNNLLLTYTSNFSTFSTGTYVNQVALAGTTTLTGVFSDPERKYISFSLPAGYSDLDSNFNSDNYTVYSTGNTVYPLSYQDNDALARKTLNGYVKKGVGWHNVLWTNYRTNAYIAANTNNTDPYNTLPGLVSTGYVRFDLDQPFSIRVMEFNSGSYATTGELKYISDTTYVSASGGIGWLQTSGSILAGTGTSYGSSPYVFDFAHKNYGIFLSYSGNPSNASADFLHYTIRADATSMSGIYINPINDSSGSYIQYLGNDIIINSRNEFISKQTEITVPKP